VLPFKLKFSEVAAAATWTTSSAGRINIKPFRNVFEVIGPPWFDNGYFPRFYCNRVLEKLIPFLPATGLVGF